MRRFILVAMMSAFFLSSISAVEVNLNLLAIRSSETNIFSDPLPQNGSNDFLKGVVEKPYLDRTDYGVKADADLFFIPESRTGLSFSFTYSHPVSATETYPVADDGTSFDDKEPAKWHYEQRDALSDQHGKLSFALGPVFRFRYSAIEIGSAVRFAISTYNFFDSFTFGVEAQPYFKAHFNSWLYATLGLSFTANIFHFIDSEVVFYETNYTMISLCPYLGIGFRFGGGNAET